MEKKDVIIVGKSKLEIDAALRAKELSVGMKFGLAIYTAAKEKDIEMYRVARAVRYLKNPNQYMKWEDGVKDAIVRYHNFCSQKDYECFNYSIFSKDYGHDYASDFAIDVMQHIGEISLLRKIGAKNNIFENISWYRSGHSRTFNIVCNDISVSFFLDMLCMVMKISTSKKERILRGQEMTYELPYWFEWVLNKKIY